MSDDKKSNKVDKGIQIINTTDLINLLNDGYNDYDSSDSDSDSNTDSNNVNYNEWEYKEINKEVNSIDDLIELGNKYNPDEKVRYNIDLLTLNKLIKPLEKLKSMIGLNSVKQNIADQIIYNLQKLDSSTDEMMHTVIQGSPGVGKTMLGQILGEIYFNMGIIKGNNKRNYHGEQKYEFKIVKRSDLIGKYLGHTAAKTQKVIDSCRGGVLFIDEAYSLGNSEGRDSFSKECIDTLNQNLTENKGNLLCIIAGYKDALEKCFFAYNEGLSRRFTFRYTIEPYSKEELRLIFIKMVKDIGWSIEDKDIPIHFFEKNYDHFKNMAGDIETLIFNVKIEHSKRVFCKPELRKKLNYEDIKKGFKKFCDNKNENEKNNIWKDMFI